MEIISREGESLNEVKEGGEYMDLQQGEPVLLRLTGHKGKR